MNYILTTAFFLSTGDHSFSVALSTGLTGFKAEKHNIRFYPLSSVFACIQKRLRLSVVIKST